MDDQYDKRKKYIINVAYFAIVVVLIYVIFKYVLGLVSPFVFALLIAFLLEKPAKFTAKTLHLPKKLVSFIFVLLFYGTIGVGLAFAGIRIVSVLTEVISAFPDVYENQLAPFMLNWFDQIEEAFYRLDPAVVSVITQGFDQFVLSLGDNISNISISLVSAVSGIASSLPLFLIRTLLMVISTFFIAGDYEMLVGFVRKQLSGRSNDLISRIKQYLGGTLFIVVRSYALIMSITFLELSIGFSIINIPNAILIALIIAFFDILPIFGTGGVMVPWTVISFIQGDYQLGIGLLVIYLFVTIVRNVLEPKIVGSQLGLHPIVTLMCMFIGVNVFGVLGLFGLPITMSLFKHLNDTGAVKFWR